MAEVQSITIVIKTKTGEVTIVQQQDTSLNRRGRRSGRDMLNAALADARSWLTRNGRSNP